MSEDLNQAEQSPEQSGVDVTPVAGESGDATPQQTQDQNAGTPQNLDQIVALRISQREKQIREEERQKVLAELNMQQPQSDTPQPYLQQPYQQQIPQLDLNQLNDQFYTAFMQNPIQTIYQVASSIAQGHVKQLEEQIKYMQYRSNLQDLAVAHPHDIKEVVPLMKPILDKYPVLAETREGLEIAYNAAKGQLTPQQLQASVEAERQMMAQANQQIPGATPQGSANQQGGGTTPKSAESALIDMIIGAK